MIHCSGSIRKFPEKCLSPETCSGTKYRSHHAVSLLQFSENCEKATRQSPKKTFMEMVSLREKISCDLWFSLPDMKVNPKSTVNKNSCP